MGRVRIETRDIGGGVYEIRANTSCCPGEWVPLPSGGGGGAFLPLAGGTMNAGGATKVVFPASPSPANPTKSELNSSRILFVGNPVNSQTQYTNQSFSFSDAVGTTSYSYTGSLEPSALVTIPGHSGALQVNSGVQYESANADYGVGKTLCVVDASSGPVTITLPFPNVGAGFPTGMIARVTKVDATPNAVTVVPQLGSINGLPSRVITTQYESISFCMGISDWHIV